MAIATTVLGTYKFSRKSILIGLTVIVSLIGGLSTLVASYLARARGSNEPELSITRVKDLEHFIRECDAFQMDYGHVMTNEHDEQLFRFRSNFEELLGNANGYAAFFNTFLPISSWFSLPCAANASWPRWFESPAPFCIS